MYQCRWSVREPFSAALKNTDIPPHSGPPETEADTLEERIKRAFDKQQIQLASILSSIDALPVQFVPEFLLRDGQAPIWTDNDSQKEVKYDENLITDEAKQMMDDFSVTDYVPAMGGSSVAGSSVSEGKKEDRRNDGKIAQNPDGRKHSHDMAGGRGEEEEEDREPTEAELNEQAALLGLSPRHMGGDDGDGMDTRLSGKVSIGSLGSGSLGGIHVVSHGEKPLKGVVSMDRASGFVRHHEPLLVLSWSNVLLQKGMRIPLAWDKEQ